MEIIITLVILAVVYIIKVMLGFEKREPAGKQQPPRKAMGEVFPVVEILEPTVKPRPAKKRVQPAEKVRKPAVSTAASAPNATGQAPELCKKSGIFKEKSEIKKAIIYSEIFNRKYN